MTSGHLRFEFLDYAVEGRLLRLRYRLAGGRVPAVSFEERLELPAALPAPDPSNPRCAALLSLVHLSFGVSYFKASAPQPVVAKPLAAGLAAYGDQLYTEGLGEFYFRQKLDPTGIVQFPRLTTPAVQVQPTAACAPATEERVLVLVGGGKDSVVAREVVRHAGVAAAALSLGTAPYIERSAAVMGLEHHVVKRHLDPQLLDLNAAGARNGHVPISACVAAIAVLCAELGGFAGVVVANERSADECNATFCGLDINHQWSKSSTFEAAFTKVLNSLLVEPPAYFSLLRPLSELAITKCFLEHPEYFEDITSCNKNFRLTDRGPVARWCGHCPKCVFVYLMAAPHASAAQLQQVFGRDFLGDEANRALLREIVGLTELKPWECVGTVAESRSACARLAAQGRLPPSALAVWAECASVGADWAGVMTPEWTGSLSSLWQGRLRAYLRDH